MKIFGHLFITENEKAITNRILSNNEKEYQEWYYRNLIFPVLILFVTIIVYIVVKEDFWGSYIIIFNGSISLLGINVLFSMSSNLMRIKEKDDNDDEGNDDNKKVISSELIDYSSKLSNLSYLFIFYGSIFYIIQSIFLPTNLIYKSVVFILVILGLFFSIKIGLRMYLLRSDLIEKTFDFLGQYEEAKKTKQRVMEEYFPELRGKGKK